MGQHVLVICTITNMIINKHIGFDEVVDPGKSKGILCVGFYEVPVQIKISGIASESIAFRSVLVYPARAVPVQAASDIVHRDYANDQVLVFFFAQFTLGQVAQQQHARVNSVRLSRMDPVVDEQGNFVFFLYVIEA